MSLRRGLACLSLVACTAGGVVDSADEALRSRDASSPATALPPVKTVFVIVLENHAWSEVKGNPSAPYLNGTLLAQGAHAEAYFNPPRLHPSEPNYIWLEAGSNLGITTDADVSSRHSIPATTDHLTAQLTRAGKTWRSYQEDMPTGICPIASTGLYAPKHNPMVFFQDVSGSPPSKQNAGCIKSVRPFTELAGDLAAGKAADYDFLTPNLCHDSHGALGCPADLVKTADDWLAKVIPQIQASPQYRAGGAIFVTWDESEDGDFPIGMIVLSPFVKHPGKANSIPYTHSSTLATVEGIFGLPKLRDAARATDLSDLFAP